MQFFNLSLISILAMTISAAPAMTSTITTVTPVQVTTSTETVLVEQGTILNKAVDQFQGLSAGQKAGVAVGGAALGAGVIYGGYHAVNKAIDYFQTPKQQSMSTPDSQGSSHQNADGTWSPPPTAFQSASGAWN